MRVSPPRNVAATCAALMALLNAATEVDAAPEVWGGLEVSFTKAPSTGTTEEANQDRITGNVWLTRDPVQGGLFNATVETMWDFTTSASPAGTEWAAAGLNGNPESISSADHASLNFTTFMNAYGGAGGLAFNIIGRRTVVHLIEDDIYLELEFQSWGIGAQGGGGAFSYLRSGPPAAAPPMVPIAHGEGGAVIIEFTGTLQSCDDLVSWVDLDPQPASPYVLMPGPEAALFFRSWNDVPPP